VLDSKSLKNIDWVLLLVVPVITALGIVAIYSASGGGHTGLTFAQRQLSSAIVGVAVLFLFAALDDHILPRISGWIYWANVALLLLVDIAGHSSKGAQRWLSIGPIQIQPSEPAKIVLIITLAVFFVQNYDEIRDVRTVLRSLVHVGLPGLLIFKQPDLGSALVIGVIWMGVSLAAGVRWQHVAVVVGCALLAFMIAWNTGFIRDYQKQRLSSFVNPDADPRGSGYHIRQSRIAIGSGQLSGKGLGKGTQSQLKFIPEQKTDFIFTVVGEEMGFAGSAAVVLLYWLLLSRAVLAMQSTEERLGRLVAGGVACMLLFHIFVNVGMTLGIMPVTGVPLPLFSYGRSNLISTMAALGLVMGVFSRRHKIAF